MITKDNNLKVMELFFKSPYRVFHLREIARITGISSSGIIKIVHRLKKEHLLVSRKTRVMEELRPDFEGKFVLMKRLYNLYSISESGLLGRLQEFYELPPAIILFGSYSNGTDSEKSDIDLAVITPRHDFPNGIDKFERILGKKINIHLISLSSASDEFKNSLANGIVLEGFVKLL